jgi:hypothetical protein
MEYRIPDPKDEKQWLHCLVFSYKTLKGVEWDDRHWDAANWGRSAKAAKILLGICGELRRADTCMVELAQGFEDQELSWTLETICRHAHDWMQRKREGISANTARKRFFDALAKQGAEGQDSSDRKITTPRALPDNWRDVRDLHVETKPDPGLPDSGNGSNVG